LKRFNQYILAWLRIRLYLALPFLRPSRLVVKGKLSLGWRSVIVFDAKSKVIIQGDCKLNRTVIQLQGSDLILGDGTAATNARIVLIDSKMEVGKKSQFENALVYLTIQSSLQADDYFHCKGKGLDRLPIYAAGARLKFADNVNVKAELYCQHSTFSCGSTVFLNEGTQIRCHKGITLGSNIMVSYDCLIFDTNTHSLSAADRRKEFSDGYPNNAVQNKESRDKVKTAPVQIGNDVWIGTRAIILKGTILGNEVIVGAASVISGMQVPDGKIVSGNPASFKP